MSGQLQIVGGWTGAAGGKGQWETPTASGTKAMPEVRDVLLEANVTFKVKVPAEAVACSASFQSAGSPSLIKVWTNLDAGEGCTVSSLAGFKFDLATGVTEVNLKSASPPIVFQLFFI